jgi:hypothetical protein
MPACHSCRARHMRRLPSRCPLWMCKCSNSSNGCWSSSCTSSSCCSGRFKSSARSCSQICSRTQLTSSQCPPLERAGSRDLSRPGHDRRGSQCPDDRSPCQYSDCGVTVASPVAVEAATVATSVVVTRTTTAMATSERALHAGGLGACLPACLRSESVCYGGSSALTVMLRCLCLSCRRGGNPTRIAKRSVSPALDGAESQEPLRSLQHYKRL